MTRTLVFSSLCVSLFICAAQAQPGAVGDIISTGANRWIFHTPDDGRKNLFIAPSTNGEWDWHKQTVFYNDGRVDFSGAVHAQHLITGSLGSANSWTLFSPDGAAHLAIAPLAADGKDWNWGKQTVFSSNGNVNFSGDIQATNLVSSGNLYTRDIVSQGSNSWVFHTPDDHRKDLFIAPHNADGTNWEWSKQTVFRNNGQVIFSGSIGIGTSETGSLKLAVEGKIGARKIQVKAPGSPWPDYVFCKNYQLKPLFELEHYIQANQHLPEVPSAGEVAKIGINVAEMDALLLKKIEELTLYMIEQSKKIQYLETENKKLNKEILELKNK